MARYRIEKTVKLYVGGKFIRSESGVVMSETDANGRPLNVAKASRKDLRDCIKKARAAQPGWEGKTGYNRGQILYRLAEMLEDRASALPTAEADVFAATDRAVHHAGWADKVTAVLSTLNPVAATYVNYSKIRALGVVVVAPDPAEGLLGIVEAALASAVMGNATIVAVPASMGELGVAFAEALATSDFPGGVINVLYGDVDDMLMLVSKHDDVDGLWLSGNCTTQLTELQIEAARVMRRIAVVDSAKRPAAPIEMQKLAEVQTVWMSAYEPAGGAAAY